jgi:hypothetical protein
MLRLRLISQKLHIVISTDTEKLRLAFVLLSRCRFVATDHAGAYRGNLCQRPHLTSNCSHGQNYTKFSETASNITLMDMKSNRLSEMCQGVSNRQSLLLPRKMAGIIELLDIQGH